MLVPQKLAAQMLFAQILSALRHILQGLWQIPQKLAAPRHNMLKIHFALRHMLKMLLAQITALQILLLQKQVDQMLWGQKIMVQMLAAQMPLAQK